jgi:N utilization substance protein A
MTLKLTAEEMRHIALFEGLTGVHVKDCVIHESGGLITFVVKEGEMGLAIGKNGSKIKRAERLVGKNVEVVEYSEEPTVFVRNVLAPARVKSVEIIEQAGKKIVAVSVEIEDKKVAIGRRGRKIENAKKLVERHHEIQDMILK